jgi:rhomboid protease GluP
MEQTRARPAGAPWLTLTLLAVLIAVYCVELVLGIPTLVAAGGSSRNEVLGNGDWFRLMSAPFLHGSFLHILLNGVVLLWGGAIMERLVGPAWFAAIYAVSGISGSLLSIAVNPPNVPSVGASGALMGVMASLFVTSFHFPTGPLRTQLRVAALQVLVPSLIPVFTAITGQAVDYGAHAGGAIGGAVTALVMLALWRHTEGRPRLRPLAAAVGLAALAAAAVSAWKVGDNVQSLAMLIPDSEYPRTDADWKTNADRLTARFPHDPRVRLNNGIVRLEAGDSDGAERELRAGLADAVAMRRILRPQVEAFLRTNLASAILRTRPAEARAVAEPVCRMDTPEMRTLRSSLKRKGLCD